MKKAIENKYEGNTYVVKCGYGRGCEQHYGPACKGFEIGVALMDGKKLFGCNAYKEKRR